jgi:hypothetical protein
MEDLGESSLVKVSGHMSSEERAEVLEEEGYGGAVIDFYDGFIDWTGEPISFLSPVNNPLTQYNLGGRDRLMAYMPPHPEDLNVDDFSKPEWPEYPVANQINPNISIDKLEEIEEGSDFHRHAVYVSSTRGFDMDILEYMEDSDFFSMVNPLDLRPILYDKMKFANWADDDHPVLPTEDLGDVYLNGREWTEDRLGKSDRLILKRNRSAGGKGVREVSYEDIRELGDESNINDSGTGYSVQPLVEHNVDKRLKLIDEVIAAENRWGDPEDIRCNLTAATQTELKEDEETKAMKVYAYDLAEPLSVGDAGRLNELEPEAIEIGENLYNDLADEFADPQLSTPNLVVAADVIKTDSDNLNFLPREYLEDLPHDTEGNAYLLNEAGNSSGSILDRLYYWNKVPENIPSLHITEKLRDVAGYNTQEPSQHVNDPTSRIWNRIARQYEHPGKIDGKCEEYREEGLLGPL